MQRLAMGSGKTVSPTKPDTLPAPMPSNSPMTSARERPGSRVSMDSSQSCIPLATCIITRACGWRPMWCTGGGCAGRLVHDGFCSICWMAIPPVTTCRGSGLPVRSVINPIFSTAKTCSATPITSIANTAHYATRAHLTGHMRTSVHSCFAEQHMHAERCSNFFCR